MCSEAARVRDTYAYVDLRDRVSIDRAVHAGCYPTHVRDRTPRARMRGAGARATDARLRDARARGQTHAADSLLPDRTPA